MKYLKLIFFMVLSSYVFGQSGFYTTHANGSGEVSFKQTSMNNAWLGSTFSYQLQGDSDLSDAFLFNASVLYNLKFSENINLPIVGNLGLPLSDSPGQVNVGLYPWGFLHDSKQSSILWHGGVRYGLLPNQNSETSPQDLRVFAGVEFAFRVGQDGLPLTVSIAPTYDLRNMGRENLAGVQTTFIVPIAKGIGLMGQHYLAKEATTFNAGVIMNTALGGN